MQQTSYSHNQIRFSTMDIFSPPGRFVKSLAQSSRFIRTTDLLRAFPSHSILPPSSTSALSSYSAPIGTAHCSRSRRRHRTSSPYRACRACRALRALRNGRPATRLDWRLDWHRLDWHRLDSAVHTRRAAARSRRFVIDVGVGIDIGIDWIRKGDARQAFVDFVLV